MPCAYDPLVVWHGDRGRTNPKLGLESSAFASPNFGLVNGDYIDYMVFAADTEVSERAGVLRTRDRSAPNEIEEM